MIAACGHFSLTICQFCPFASEAEKLQPLLSYIDALHPDHAHVVMSFGDAEFETRGHFSRLFTDAQWRTHRNAVEQEDIAFSDTTLTSSNDSSDLTHVNDASVSDGDDAPDCKSVDDEPMDVMETHGSLGCASRSLIPLSSIPCLFHSVSH